MPVLAVFSFQAGYKGGGIAGGVGRSDGLPVPGSVWVEGVGVGKVGGACRVFDLLGSQD